MRRALLLLVALVVGFAPAPVFKSKPLSEEFKALQGEWVLASRTYEGLPVNHVITKITIRDDQMTYEDASGAFRRTWKLTLTTQGSPRRLDATMELPPYKPEYFRGIYKISGDTLTTCYVSVDTGMSRPTEFEPRRECTTLDVLKRKKQLIQPHPQDDARIMQRGR